MNNIGDIIRKIREENGDTVAELKDKLEVNEADLIDIEKGQEKPSLKLLRKVALVYNVSLSRLIGEDPEETDEINNKYEKWLPFINKMEEKGIAPDDLLEMFNKVEKDHK